MIPTTAAVALFLSCFMPLISSSRASVELSNVNIINVYQPESALLINDAHTPPRFQLKEGVGLKYILSKCAVILNPDGETYSILVHNLFLRANPDEQTMSAVASTGDAGTKFKLIQHLSRNTFTIKTIYNTYVSAGASQDAVQHSGDITDAEQFYFVSTVDAVSHDINGAVREEQLLDDAVRHHVQTIPLLYGNYATTPAVFASIMSAGNDPADIKIDNVGPNGFEIALQEEISKDAEVGRTYEDIGLLALEDGVISNRDGNPIGEVGRLTVPAGDGVWLTHSEYELKYAQDPVVLIMTNTRNNVDPGRIRLRNVGKTSFDYKYEEWKYQDGRVDQAELAVYLILEPGTHELENGDILHVMTTDSVEQTLVTADYAEAGFSDRPVVLAQIQTTNGSDPCVTRIRDATATSAKVKIQEEEASDKLHLTEVIGIVAHTHWTST